MKKATLALAVLGLVAVAHLAQAAPPGGRVTGTTRVDAYRSNLHTVVYRGGEEAVFAVVGDGDTTLNVIVRDEFGNIVRRTSGPGDVVRVSWVPRWTGVFTIEVINEGGVYNQYGYSTN